MSKQNITEVTNLFDLKTLISSNTTVIVGFTISSTDPELKKFIRKFLKRKSEKFPLLFFVYMEVSESNRNQLNILNGDDDEYPKMYHIRGGNQIIVSTTSANEHTITESFSQVEKYYINEMNNNDSTNDSNLINISSPENMSDEDNNGQSNNSQQNNLKQNNSQQNNLKQNNSQLINPQPKVTCDQQNNILENPEIEKRKNLEKLVLLNRMCDDMKISLVKNIAKRKKIEANIEKNNKKEEDDDQGKEYRKRLRHRS